MRIAIVTAALTMVLAFAAQAMEVRTPVGKQMFTCAAPGVSRISTDEVAPCCDGQMKCAQYLSTTKMVKPRPVART